MSWTLHDFDTNASLVEQLSRDIGRLLCEAIRERGRATLAVSGGSTPRTLFEALACLDLPWGHVTVTLVDERWVDENDAASNARLVRRSLLQGHAGAARFVGLKTGADDPAVAAAEVDSILVEEVLGSTGSLDVAILGMGEDGHTASFLPDSEGLEEAISAQPRYQCCAIRPPMPALPRMTLTLDTLLQARHLILHFIGDVKFGVFQHAALVGAVEDLPVRAVLHQHKRPLEIYYARQ